MTDDINSTVLDEGAAHVSTLNDGLESNHSEPMTEVAKDDRTDAVAKAFDQVAKGDDADKPDDEGEKVSKDAKAEKVETAEKPAKEVKDVADPEQKDAPAKPVEAAAKVPADGQEKADRQASEARQYSAPPARYLPEATAKWDNVPNSVKAEIFRVNEEYEREISEHKAFRDDLRDYEDIAKQHNVTIKGTLDRYVSADRALNEDFGKGVMQLMQMYGKEPVQAINGILRAHGVEPEQYAQHVLNNPNAHARPVQQAPQPQQPQSNQEIEMLRNELNEMKREQQTASVTPIIEQFAQHNPDFNHLQSQIANILKSGIIEQNYGSGLTHQQKLEQAYRMAGGRPSSAMAETADVDHSEPQKARPVDLDGQKSINGAPNFGKEPKQSSRRVSSYEDTVRQALMSLGK